MYLNRVRQFLMLSVMVITFPLQANEFTGHWRGELSLPQGQSIEMVFHLKQGDDGLQGVVDVPAQKQFGLVFNSVEVAAKHITLKLDLAGIVYQGELNADQIIGHYQQGSFAAPLNLIRLASSDAEALGQRTVLPQEPTRPLPYEQLDVSFVNNAQQISLSGVLSIPKGPIKAAVVLLSGSGPTTKDADAFGHKLFLVLADLLTRRGLAVLRYDDRGVGGSSGDYGSATIADFAQDALAAQAFYSSISVLNTAK
ncbi:hypothetical protein [Paraglaciecola sp.]|uniref:alpha/beta hydrolase family protein n=1 Tax=Paraglaciecola sp. TaxID=1920173 RepID=UPI0030F4A058